MNVNLFLDFAPMASVKTQMAFSDASVIRAMLWMRMVPIVLTSMSVMILNHVYMEIVLMKMVDLNANVLLGLKNCPLEMDVLTTGKGLVMPI